MKKLFFIIVFCLGLQLLLANNIAVRELPNGMRIVAKERNSVNTVALYCFVHTGSIHEDEFLGKGISHYLEHIVSGGSTSFRTEEEYNEIERRIGASTNAFTTYNMTAYHIMVEEAYADSALMILSEQMMHCVFDQREVDREKQVIIKEIIMRTTPPMSQVIQRASEVFNPNSNYRYPIIGYVDQFQTLSREDLIKYYDKRYRPNNFVFVAVGNFEADKMADNIEKAFSDFNKAPAVDVYLPEQPIAMGTYKIVDEFDIEQAYTMINRQIPIHLPKDYYALVVASDILFGKRSSPVSKLLEEDKQLVNFIYSYADFNPISKTGFLRTMFETKQTEDINQTLDLYFAQLEEYTRPKKINQKMIDSVIKRFEARRYLNNKSIDDEATEIGFSMFTTNTHNSEELLLQEIKKVTVQDVQRVIREYYLNNYVIFCAVPRGQKEILESFSDKNIIQTELTKSNLNNALLLHKQNTELPVVRGIIFIPSSTDYETEVDSGTLDFMVNVLFSGSRKYPPAMLSEWLEENSITLNASANRLGIYIEFASLSNDFSLLTDVLSDLFTRPVFDQNEIDLLKNRIYANHMRSMSHPVTHHSEFRSSKIYLSDRERLTNRESFDIIANLNREDLLNAYKKYISAENITVSLIGDIDLNESRKFVNTIRSKIPVRKVNDVRKSMQMIVSDSLFINNYLFEQVNIDISMKAPSIENRSDFIVMQVISSLLNGSRGRIFNAVRGNNDLAYFAYASYMYGHDYGMFRLTSQTSTEKMNDLIEVLKNQVNLLKTELVEEKEILLAVDDNYKTLKNYLEDEYLAYYSLYFEVLGLGYDFFETSIEEYRKVSPEDIKRVANKYFDKMDVIVSKPLSE